eukprot:gene19370-25237_t
MSINDYEINDLEPSFEQIPYVEILKRIDNGTQCIIEFSRIISSALENMQKNIAYTSSVSRTHIYENEIAHSGCERSLGFFKNYHLFVAKGQVQYYKDLSEIIFKSIEEVKNNRITISNKHKNAVLNATKEVALATESLDKAKKLYAKANLEMLGAKDKLQQLDIELERIQEEKKSNFMGRMLSAFESTPSQDRDKQQRRVHKRLNNVILCSNEITAKKKILREKLFFRDYVIAQATEAAQALEYERIACIKENIKRFCELEEELINTRKHLLTSLQEVVETMNVKDDIQLFVKIEKKVEFTHKYSKAIDLLDWDYSRRSRQLDNSDISHSDTIIEGGKEPLLSTVHIPIIDDESNDRSIPSAAVVDSHFNIAANDNVTGSPPNSKTLVSKMKKSLRLSSQKLKVKDPTNNFIELNSEIRTSNTVSKSDLNDDDENLDDSIDEDQVPTIIDNNNSNNNGDASVEITFGTPSNSYLSVNAVSLADDSIVGEVIDIPSSDISALASESKSTVSNAIKEALEYIFNDNNITSDDKNKYTSENELDDKRGRYSQLTIPGYEAMKFAMKVKLDFSNRLQDVKSALRIVNMANTFHCITVNGEHSVEGNKLYLLKEDVIKGHSIWHGKGFWEYSLIERLSTELQVNTPVLWDELSPEALREAVVGIHNIVFGQLGTIAFTMHELGLPFEEVQATVLEMCRGAQLVEEQEHDLLKSIRRTFNITSKNNNASIWNDSADYRNVLETISNDTETLNEHVLDSIDDIYVHKKVPLDKSNSIDKIESIESQSNYENVASDTVEESYLNTTEAIENKDIQRVESVDEVEL